MFLHVEYWALLWYSHIIHNTRKLARLHLIGARPVLDEMIGVFAPRDFYPSKTNSWPFASFTTCITTILNLNIHRLSFCRTICLNLESTIVVGNFLMTWELDAASVEAALGRWRKIRCRCLQDSFEESCIWNWCKRCKWSDPVSLLFVRSKNAHGWSFLYLFVRYPKWILFETNGMNDENFGPGTERQLSCTDVIRKFDWPMAHEFRNIIKCNHIVTYCHQNISCIYIKLSSGIMKYHEITFRYLFASEVIGLMTSRQLTRSTVEALVEEGYELFYGGGYHDSASVQPAMQDVELTGRTWIRDWWNT